MIRIWTDASHDPRTGRVCWGFKTSVHSKYRCGFIFPEKSHSQTGEYYAIIKALEWCRDGSCVTVYTDQQVLANNPDIYQRKCLLWRYILQEAGSRGLQVRFKWVKSGVDTEHNKLDTVLRRLNLDRGAKSGT